MDVCETTKMPRFKLRSSCVVGYPKNPDLINWYVTAGQLCEKVTQFFDNIEFYWFHIF